MTLHFLGIGAAFYPPLGNTSAWLKKDKTLYLLDCGGTAFQSLYAERVWDGIASIVVFLTHLHADHAGSLGTLISYCRLAGHADVTVVHPQDTVHTLLGSMGITKDQYRHHAGMSYEDAALRVTFHSVTHTDALYAYGLLLSDGEESVYFSGDAAGLPDEILTRFLRGEINRLYQDISFLQDRPRGHGSYPTLKAAIPPARRRDVYPIHWDTDAAARIAADGFGVAYGHVRG